MRLAKLLAQTVQGSLLTPHAEERTFSIGTLGQDLATREYASAQLLGRPGQEQLGLDQIALEKSNDRLMQFRDVVGTARTHHDAAWIRGAQRGFAFGLCRRIADVVDLVENSDARHVLRLDLVQHVLGGLDLPFESRVAGVDDVKQQRGIQRLFQRGLERRDQSVWQVLDETDRIADQYARDTLGKQGAYGGVERGEELVGDQHFATRECTHQGGLACVGVADERHAGEPLVRLSPRALRLAVGVPRRDLLLQLGDAVANLALVQFGVRLAGPASANTAALPPLWPGKLRRLAQARRQVAQTRDFHLRARSGGACVAVKDLENDHGAIHHLAADFVFEMARLRRGNLVVDEDDVDRVGRDRRFVVHSLDSRVEAIQGVQRTNAGRGFAIRFALDKMVDLPPLAHAQIGRRVEAGPFLRERTGIREAQCLGQFAQLGQRGFKLHVAHPWELNRRHDGVLRGFFDFFLHAAWFPEGERSRALSVNAIDTGAETVYGVTWRRNRSADPW